ncbi:hypothetical protein MKW98_016904 [Papaver atlanticum]|uniref:Uncharacterized protein n=1 Tax=Papaver atlanticum TaxID=357466 RepID=A0AAD4TKB7_9MAGN|nr:hypothetical protein MKW98_016904 [Papaver atlanticum]
MDNLSLGKMENMPLLEPNSKPPITPKGPYDARATFICSIRISAKQFKISIASRVNISSRKQMSVIVPTNEPISFAVGHKTFMYCLWAMIPGKEIHRIGWPNRCVHRYSPL